MILEANQKRLPDTVLSGFLGAIEAFLDEALVTDDEMFAGPEHWLTFEDPLPSWEHSQPAQG